MDKRQYNDDLRKRQIEINEWSYKNRMDTLFVFQLIFISLLFVGILMGLKLRGVVGSLFVSYCVLVLLFLLIIIIVNRAVYTNKHRDTQNWNRKKFNGDRNVNSPLERGDMSFLAYLDSLRNTYPNFSWTSTSGSGTSGTSTSGSGTYTYNTSTGGSRVYTSPGTSASSGSGAAPFDCSKC
jgi:hypothetical protein